jgi:hypothetical protein
MTINLINYNQIKKIGLLNEVFAVIKLFLALSLSKILFSN